MRLQNSSFLIVDRLIIYHPNFNFCQMNEMPSLDILKYRKEKSNKLNAAKIRII